MTPTRILPPVSPPPFHRFENRPESGVVYAVPAGRRDCWFCGTHGYDPDDNDSDPRACPVCCGECDGCSGKPTRVSRNPGGWWDLACDACALLGLEEEATEATTPRAAVVA